MGNGQTKTSVLEISYSTKISHGAILHVFHRPAGEHENKNFNERTLKLEDSPPSLFQDLCGSLLVLAPLHDGYSMCLA